VTGDENAKENKISRRARFRGIYHGRKKKDMEIGEIVVRELACILPLLGSTRDTRTSTIEYRTRRKETQGEGP
jgi:hypothetical protein